MAKKIKTAEDRAKARAIEKKSWIGNIAGDLWGGAVTTFALLPETIGFMIAAGVPPYIGLYTCIILTITLAITGGRPGVISAGAGSTAMITVGLVAAYWQTHPEYLFAAVVLAGIIQLILGIVRFGSLIKFIPDCVMHGFVNGLAILIFISQVKLIFKDFATLPEMLALVGIGVGIIVFFPFLKKIHPFFGKIPSSLVAIVILSIYAIASGSDVLRIRDMGTITPGFEYVGMVFTRLPNVFSGECFANIIPVSISLAMVGIIETMLTCRVVTEETNTPEQEDLNRECRGQGIGNIICGLLGAMPGCAMIGQTKANLGAGGRGRLSSLFAGGLLAALLFSVSRALGAIPVAALVAVMLVVCYETFNWGSVFKAHKVPIKETMSMALTVIVVLATDNLAYGVGFGIALYVIMMIFKMFIVSEKVMIGIAIAATGAAIGILCAGFATGLGGVALVMFMIAIFGISTASLVRNEMMAGKGLKAFSTVLMIICAAIAVTGVVFMYVG